MRKTARMKRVPSLLVTWTVLAALAACAPKGSGTPPTLSTTSLGAVVIKHPTFEAHLDPKVVRDGTKTVVKLVYSGFPDKSSMVLDGKTVALARVGGDVTTATDLTRSIGDAPIAALTAAAPVATNIPFELAFFDGRQKLSSAIASVRPWQELRRCLRRPPCTFASDGPPNAKANIVVYTSDPNGSETLVGAPSRVRDIDWVATIEETKPVAGKTCKMQRMSNTALTDELTLQRVGERVTVVDRRSGATVGTKELTGPDRCPLSAEVKFDGPGAGLRSPVDEADRTRWFAELRGEATPAAAASAGGASSKGSKSKSKPKPKK